MLPFGTTTSAVNTPTSIIASASATTFSRRWLTNKCFSTPVINFSHNQPSYVLDLAFFPVDRYVTNDHLCLIFNSILFFNRYCAMDFGAIEGIGIMSLISWTV